jgi:hypothetical protein
MVSAGAKEIGWCDRRTASVTTGERFEPVFHDALVRVGTDSICDHDPRGVEVNGGVLTNVIGDGCSPKSTKIWPAAGEKVGSRLSKQQLHALSDQKCRCERQCKSHPAYVPFPEFPPPDERLRGAAAGCWSWYKDDANEENDGGRNNERNDNQKPGWDLLRFLEGVRYVEIDKGEWSLERRQKLPACTNGGDSTAQLSVKVHIWYSCMRNAP